MDCSLPGFSVHGNSQTGILEWVAITFLSEASMEFNKVFLLHRGVSLPYRAPCFYFRAEKKCWKAVLQNPNHVLVFTGHTSC